MTDPRRERQLAEQTLDDLRKTLHMQETSVSARGRREFAIKMMDERSLSELLDGIWDLLVNCVRPCYSHDREVGEKAGEALKHSAVFREAWPVILASGLFAPQDDRIAAIDAFMTLGAFVFALDDPDDPDEE
jgi:hypothetical protein